MNLDVVVNNEISAHQRSDDNRIIPFFAGPLIGSYYILDYIFPIQIGFCTGCYKTLVNSWIVMDQSILYPACHVECLCMVNPCDQ